MKKKVIQKIKKAGGRPTLWKDEYTKLVYGYCLLGLTDDQLAGVLGIDVNTLNVWKREKPKFMESITAGKTNADAKVAQSLYNRALGKKADVQAIKYWLNNTQRKNWSERQQVEHSGQVEFAAFLQSIDGTANKLPSSRASSAPVIDVESSSINELN